MVTMLRFAFANPHVVSMPPPARRSGVGDCVRLSVAGPPRLECPLPSTPEGAGSGEQLASRPCSTDESVVPERRCRHPCTRCSLGLLDPLRIVVFAGMIPYGGLSRDENASEGCPRLRGPVGSPRHRPKPTPRLPGRFPHPVDLPSSARKRARGSLPTTDPTSTPALKGTPCSEFPETGHTEHEPGDTSGRSIRATNSHTRHRGGEHPPPEWRGQPP